MSKALAHFRKFFLERMSANAEGHFHALGLTNAVIEKGMAQIDMPYNEQLIGNPETGVMAGGAMTALLDTCCAIAAATSMDKIAFIPTLDLRIDHMGMAEPNKTLIARSEAYRVSQSVIFTRGIIYQDDPERPVVRALVNFTPIDNPVTHYDKRGKQP